MVSFISKCEDLFYRSSCISNTTMRWFLDGIVKDLELISNDRFATINALEEITRGLNLGKRWYRRDSIFQEGVIDHKLNILIMNTLIQIMNKWHENGIIDENERLIFFNSSTLLLDVLCNTDKSNIKGCQKWLLNDSFIKSIAQCIQDVAISGSYLNDISLQSLCLLVDALSIFQRSVPNDPTLALLIEPVLQCICSQYYFAAVKTVPLHSNNLNIPEDFLLRLCPAYFRSYQGEHQEQIYNKLFEKMLAPYEDTLGYYNSYIQQWNDAILISIESIIGILHSGARMIEKSCAKQIGQHTLIIDQLLFILNSSYLHEKIKLLSPQLASMRFHYVPSMWFTAINAETLLVYSTLTLFFYLTCEPTILPTIKERNPSSILNKLKNAEFDQVQLAGYLSLANVLSDNDIKTMENANEITFVLLRYIRDTISRPSEEYRGYRTADLQHALSISSYVTSLQTVTEKSTFCSDIFIDFCLVLAQHDQIKAEILKQNGLEVLIMCISVKSKILTVEKSLNTLWKMCFNAEAAVQLKQNVLFIQRVNELATSSEKSITTAANGILWKLIGEVKFITGKQTVVIGQENENQQHLNTAKVEDLASKVIKSSIENGKSGLKYDIMISYSHDDKNLCWELYENLFKDNFNVWIDRECICGSIAQAIADGIENSEFILICMSESYQQSGWCQSEAEYAFNLDRRSKGRTRLIPLIVQHKYNPDGWLAFVTNARNRINFTKNPFTVAYEQLIAEIERLRGTKQVKQASQQRTQDEKVHCLTTFDEESTVSVPTVTDTAMPTVTNTAMPTVTNTAIPTVRKSRSCVIL